MADAIIFLLRIFLLNSLFLIGCRAVGEKNNENLQVPNAPPLGSGHPTHLKQKPMPPKQQQKMQHPPHMPHLGSGNFRLENGQLSHGRPPKVSSNSLAQLPESTDLLSALIYNPLLPRQVSSIPHHTGIKYDAIQAQGQNQRDLKEIHGEIDEKYKQTGYEQPPPRPLSEWSKPQLKLKRLLSSLPDSDGQPVKPASAVINEVADDDATVASSSMKLQPPPLPLSEWSKPQLKLKRLLSSLPDSDGQPVKPASAKINEEADDDDYAAVAAMLIKLRERTEKEPIVYKRRKKQK